MKTTPIRPLSTCLIFTAILLLAGISHGQLINVNFNGGADAPDVSTLSGPAGGLGTSWNSVSTVDAGPLVDSTGAATTISIDTNYSNITLGPDLVGTLPIFRSYLNIFDRPNNNTVIINGLEPEGVYNIWLLSYRNITNSTTERNVGTWSTTNTTTSPGSQAINSQTVGTNGTAFVEGYNYVLFGNVKATAGGVITFTAKGQGFGFPQDSNSRRLHLNGLQIAKTTPPVIDEVDDAMSTVNASPATVFADGILTSAVTVTLKDSDGDPVPGKNVTLANTAGPQAATINPLTAVTTNGAGQAVFNVSSSTPGIELFTATDVTDTLTLTDTANVEFVVIGVLTNAAQSTVVASPPTVLADGSSASTITVTLRDANGYPVSGKNVTLANTGGPQAATISPLGAVASNASGQAVFSVNSSTIGAEQFTATDTTDSIGVTQIATVGFIDPNSPKLINVNFTGGQDPPPSSVGLVGPGGGLITSWNQFVGPDSTGTLVDSIGTATTVTIDTNFDLPNTLDTPVIDLTMLRGSVTNFGKGVDDTSVTIGGLQPGGFYKVWLVTLRNQPFGGDGTEQYVGWWSTANATTSSNSQLVDARGAVINTSTYVNGYNYVLFDNVVANGSGQIVFTGVAGPLQDGSINNHRLGLNGLQIEEVPGGGSPYDIWKSQITNGLDQRTDDADGDGFNNLQEFLLGTSPIAGNGALITTAASGGNLVLRWLQRESGATYTLKQSPTLETNSWTTVVSPLPVLDGVQTGAPTDYDYYTVTLPTGSGRLFFRIQGVEN